MAISTIDPSVDQSASLLTQALSQATPAFGQILSNAAQRGMQDQRIRSQQEQDFLRERQQNKLFERSKLESDRNYERGIVESDRNFNFDLMREDVRTQQAQDRIELEERRLINDEMEMDERSAFRDRAEVRDELLFDQRQEDRQRELRSDRKERKSNKEDERRFAELSDQIASIEDPSNADIEPIMREIEKLSATDPDRADSLRRQLQVTTGTEPTEADTSRDEKINRLTELQNDVVGIKGKDPDADTSVQENEINRIKSELSAGQGGDLGVSSTVDDVPSPDETGGVSEDITNRDIFPELSFVNESEGSTELESLSTSTFRDIYRIYRTESKDFRDGPSKKNYIGAGLGASAMVSTHDEFGIPIATAAKIKAKLRSEAKTLGRSTNKDEVDKAYRKVAQELKVIAKREKENTPSGNTPRSIFDD